MLGVFPSTFWPFFYFFMVCGAISLVGASVTLRFNLRKMWQEREEGLHVAWYRHSEVQNSLGLMIWSLGALLAGCYLIGPSPISGWMVSLLTAYCFVIGPSITLVRDIREIQQKSVWYQQPQILKQFGRIAAGLVLFLLFVTGELPFVVFFLWLLLWL